MTASWVVAGPVDVVVGVMFFVMAAALSLEGWAHRRRQRRYAERLAVRERMGHGE